MATELISLKLEKNFLRKIDSIVKKRNYQSRTEFIRAALREKIEKDNLKDTLLKLASLKGSSKKDISDEQIELVRQKVFEEISKNIE